uniref:RING-type domain-containing protein n=1 Tax=Anopheles dirus TaxID=7168 RepID=A0A182NKN4_9DIPT
MAVYSWDGGMAYIDKRSSGNEPINNSSPKARVVIRLSGPSNRGQRPLDLSKVIGMLGKLLRTPTDSNRQAGLEGHATMQYPEYATEAARLASFESWPKAMRQTPEQMADAGFFYTEKSDIVTCFSCGGIMNDWLEGDDPWVLHAVAFSGCHFLSFVKGAEFVQDCKAKQAQENTGTEAQSQRQNASEVADEKTCKVCFAVPYDVAFTPCGHLIACSTCASKVNRTYITMATSAVTTTSYVTADASIPASSLEFNRESDRLQTFTGWPAPYIRPADLARWGFYYTGRRDIVQCYFCSLELGQWDETDVVEQEHLKWSRYCPLMTKRQTDNVPIDANFLDQLPDTVPDVYGSNRAFGWDELNYAVGGESHRTSTGSNDQAVLQDAVKICKPKHPKYATETARLASFESWPKSIRQTPEQMADAGFFYTEKSDIVTCFSCGGTLKDWMEGDDPWVEHADNFSGCHYLNLVKGAEFVQQCQTRRSTEGSIETRAHCKTSEQHVDEPEVSDEKLCKICYSNPYNTTFVPCGHVVACAKCASAVDRCPLCNQRFENVLPDASIPPSSLEFNRESDRLQTFTGWPIPFISPSHLARWGFYYTGQRDIVQCYFCRCKLGQWNKADEVKLEHLRLSLQCPLMNKRRTDNVPIDPNFLDELSDSVLRRAHGCH